MSPGRISRRVVADRISCLDEMLEGLRLLPLEDEREFLSDRRNVWAAESCLRRALEALFDLGRHILTKGFGMGVSEYKEVAVKLGEKGVLSEGEVELLRTLAGYRNRLVHFYHEVTDDELYEICAHQSGDLERIKTAYIRWVNGHPEMVEE